MKTKMPHEEDSKLESKIREIPLEEATRLMEEDKNWFYDNLGKLREKYGRKGYVFVLNKEVIDFDKKRNRLLDRLKYSVYLGDLSSERAEEDIPIIFRGFTPR